MCAECGQENPAGGAFCGRCGKPQVAAGDEKPLQGVTLGSLLGKRYRLDAKLGEGGMGVVYAAHDVELDRPVAVKVLARSMTESPDVVERFEREARLTAKLEHPNVVPVYDVGRHDGRPFLVMKRLDGDTLAARLREKGGLTRDETLQLFKQLAQGIDFIHEKGFIHRDIKAHNIMVGPQGQATLLDFGILRSQRGNDALTRTGVVMGTPHYMAPELALGLTDVDHRVDLYALAVVLFECLTGTLPFEADSELGLIQLQAHAPPPDLIHRAPWIPPPVAEVVSRAMSKRPLDRYPSAASLVQALEQAFAQAPVDPQAHAIPGAQAPAVPASTAPSWRAKAKDAVVAARPVEPMVQAAAPAVTVASPAPQPTQATVDLAAVAVRRSRWPLAVVAGVVAVL
ncbi:MAG: protein kinase, partial [Myxococcaceae bacterium]|nr:protein kinase [Myxococcaceae bacterium]